MKEVLPQLFASIKNRLADIACVGVVSIPIKLNVK